MPEPLDDAVASSATDQTQATTPTSTDAAVASGDQAAYREARRAERMDRSPMPTLKTTPADSSPAAPAAQGSSTDEGSIPASEPGQPTPFKATAETRIKDLLRRQKEQEAEIARLRAAVPVEPARQTPTPAQAPISEAFPPFETWVGDHPDALYEDYLDVRADHRAAYRHAQTVAQDSQRSRVSSWTQRRVALEAADPEFWDKVDPAIGNLTPAELVPAGQPLDAGHIIAQEILAMSDPSLMVYLSAHPDEFARIRGLSTSADIIRAMGRLAERVTVAATLPVVPSLTHAPAPPLTLGRKSTDPSDDLESVVASGDQDRYKALRRRQRQSLMTR